MRKILQNKDLRISLIFTPIGLVASIYVAWYQVSMFNDAIMQQILSQLGSIEALVVIAALQGALLTFAATFLGLKIARKVHLKLNFLLDRKALFLATCIALVAAFIIVGSDRFIFAHYLTNSITNYAFSPVYLIAGILYGGIVEEILLRLLVMSLFVLILWKLFTRDKDSRQIPNGIFIAAIVLAALLFAAGHIPFTAQAIGLSVPIIIRAFVLNGLGGIGFGYLYWKKGLAYAMYAHAMTHVFMQVIFMPAFF